MDLLPSLDHDLARLEAAQDFAYDPTTFSISTPARIYVSLVRERYRNADERLIERLGEANWQRHVVIRNRIDQVAEMGVNDPPPLTSRKDALSNFQPVSVFHDSGLGTTISSPTQYERSVASHTSFLSSASETGRGAAKVPKTPIEVELGKPFQCYICGCTQYKIKNRLDWKYVQIAKRLWSRLTPLDSMCLRTFDHTFVPRPPARKSWSILQPANNGLTMNSISIELKKLGSALIVLHLASVPRTGPSMSRTITIFNFWVASSNVRLKQHIRYQRRMRRSKSVPFAV